MFNYDLSHMEDFINFLLNSSIFIIHMHMNLWIDVFTGDKIAVYCGFL